MIVGLVTGLWTQIELDFNGTSDLAFLAERGVYGDSQLVLHDLAVSPPLYRFASYDTHVFEIGDILGDLGVVQWIWRG